MCIGAVYMYMWNVCVCQSVCVYMSIYTDIMYIHACMVCVRACACVCVCVQLKFSVTDASIQSFYLQEIPHQLEVRTGNIV